MHRVYKDFLRRVLLVCLHYQELGYSMKQAISFSWDYNYRHKRSGYFTSEKREQLQKLLTYLEDGSFQNDSQNINQMIEQLLLQLSSSEANQDRDLIDTIVRIIGLPFARNSLSGGTLSHLRSAILLPDELVTLKAELKKGICCFNCGHKLMNGEMAIYATSNPGNDNQGFMCSRCAKPSYVASHTDPGKSVPANTVKGLLAALKREPIPEKDIDPASVVVGADGILAAASPAVASEVFRDMANRARRTVSTVTGAPPSEFYRYFSQNMGSAWDQPFPEPAPTPQPPAGGDSN